MKLISKRHVIITFIRQNIPGLFVNLNSLKFQSFNFQGFFFFLLLYNDFFFLEDFFESK